MLKSLPASVFSGLANAKCGEIYCHSSKSFTILCTLCEMKTFEYEDFLRHFQNIHFENDLLKTEEVNVECKPYMEVDFKREPTTNDDNLFGWLEETPALPESDGEEALGQRLMKWQNKDSDADGDGDEGNGDSDGTDNDEEYKPPAPRNESKNKTPKKVREYKCQHCEKVYKNSVNLKTHMRKEHDAEETGTSPAQVQKCEECPQEFRTQRSLERHCVDEHQGLKCTTCEKRFTSLLNLTRHAEQHTRGDEKPFVCDFQECTKRFYTLRQLRSHKRSHSGIKNYVCDVCGYSCREPETLRVHYRTHTGEKPFACKHCDRRFVSASALSEHKATHSTERPFMCAVCGRTFGRQKALYHHKFLHLGEKKFKCKICGNAYAQSSGLAGHMRKHREQGII